MLKQIERKIIYTSEWINLFTDKVLLPNGEIIEKYHVLDFEKQSVICLVENMNREILFVNAYRYVTNSIDWELPAGGIDKNEDILEAAKREVLEETGYMIENCKKIYEYYPSNGMSNQKFHIVKANLISDKSHVGKIDENEVEKIRWINEQEIELMILRNEIKDGFTLSALMLNLFRKDKNDKKTY